MLPEYHTSESLKVIRGAKLVFDATISSEYKVVCLEVILEHTRPSFKIYSSETGLWTIFPHHIPEFLHSDFDLGVYFDGAIHWPKTEALHYKLDVNHLVLTTIQNPTIVNGNVYYDHKLFESRNCLLLACIVYTFVTHSRQLSVYEMKDGSSCEWSVKYLIDYDYCMTLIPTHWKTPGGGKLICLSCISVGERNEDSFIVIQAFGKVIQHKFVLKTLSKIYDFIPPIQHHFSYHCFPFIPSLADV